MNDTVTIGNLRQAKVLLEVSCTTCGHHAYFDPWDLPFADNQEVPTAFERMVCGKCGARGSHTRPDARMESVLEPVTG